VRFAESAGDPAEFGEVLALDAPRHTDPTSTPAARARTVLTPGAGRGMVTGTSPARDGPDPSRAGVVMSWPAPPPARRAG
jgi:hypothetical protein